MKCHVNIPATPVNKYSIYINNDLLVRVDKLIPHSLSFSKIVIITDNKVKKLHAHAVNESCKKRTANVILLSIPAGEQAKIHRTKQILEEKMLAQHCGRDTLIIALGGGVVGDLAGFIAATYMRGIPYLQIPTSLLAMVDSSVGGKTGIDNSLGKNLIGAFWQPCAVIADIQCLKTLPKRHLINGLVEALKMFLTHDAQGFYYAEKNLPKILDKNELVLKRIIAKAVTIKAQVVADDEKENHQRMILNFGHTIGHALEVLSHYSMLHGYAVGLGILIEMKIAELLGILETTLFLRVQEIFARLGITHKLLQPFDVLQIIKATRLDKKAKQGQVNYILLNTLGHVHQSQKNIAHPVPDHIVMAAVRSIQNGGK